MLHQSLIETWANLLTTSYNILPMDGETFRMWARLMHRKPDALYEDAMIAATAKVHQLTVVTRNVADFGAFKVVMKPSTRYDEKYQNFGVTPKVTPASRSDGAAAKSLILESVRLGEHAV